MRSGSKELAAALDALRSRPIVSQSREYARDWGRRRRVRRRVALPALAVGLGLLAFLGLRQLPPPAARPAGQILASDIGTTRSLLLSDGSRIVLDAGSRIAVQMGPRSRNIELLEGQAQFQVAHDTARPFRVHAGGCEVVAVGTLFNVVRLPARTTVTLIEGRVNVQLLAGGQPRIESLVPGQQLRIGGDGRLLDKKPVEVADATAWQRGRIVLDDLPLADALIALNRYSQTQIVIRGALLKDRRISGVFRIGDVETEALVLRRYFGLKEAARSGGEIVLEQD